MNALPESDRPGSSISFSESGFGPWLQDAFFKLLKEHVRRAVRIDIDSLELCGGLGTAAIADACLGLNSTCVGIYDMNPDLVPWLRRLHDQVPDVIFCGTTVGDIMTIPIEEFPLAHKIVAGAPCPPWSTKGKRKSWDDERSGPFWRSLEIIVHQAQHPSEKLQCFILENVMGICNRDGNGIKPIDSIVEYLQQHLGQHWTVHVWKLNSINLGLPANRPRVYLIGRRIRRLLNQQSILPQSFVPNFARVVRLPDILENSPEEARAWNTSMYCETWRLHLDEYKSWFAVEMNSDDYSGSVACFAVDRTPSGRAAWPTKKRIDCCECLTANGPKLHILSLGQCPLSSTASLQHTESQPSHDRPLSVRERGRLQGFPDWFIDVGFADSADKRAKKAEIAFGNAMSVPAIAVATYIALSDFLNLGKPMMQSMLNYWCENISVN